MKLKRAAGKQRPTLSILGKFHLQPWIIEQLFRCTSIFRLPCEHSHKLQEHCFVFTTDFVDGTFEAEFN